MEFTQRKRIEIVTETALLRSIRLRFKDIGMTGYTVLSVQSGSGEAGEWSREGQITSAGEMAMIICLTTADRADAAIEAILPLLSRGRGVVSVSDVDIVRSERF